MPSNEERHAPCGSQARSKQRGAVLALVMILLVLLGILGLFAIQASTQQIRMANNLVSSLQAFETAESLLSIAEARLPAAIPSGWQQEGTGRYLIENIGQTRQAFGMPADLPVFLFRITAVAEVPQARVTLESVMAWPATSGQAPARRILWRQLYRES